MRSVAKRGNGPGSSIRGGRPGSREGAPAARRLRADAAANRERIIRAATDLLVAQGLEVSLDAIASRAGVGPGTLHRHFPTKAALVDATIAQGVAELARSAGELARASDPVTAFYGFFARAVEHGASSHALARRLTSAGVDVDAAIAGPLGQLRAGFATLFRRAQRAGGIRSDLHPEDLDALLAAAYAIHIHPSGGTRLLEIFCDSLHPPSRARSKASPRAR